MEKVNLKKKKTVTNNFSLSPLFVENTDDDFTNHSFSSEIHLKNNKKFSSFSLKKFLLDEKLIKKKETKKKLSLILSEVKKSKILSSLYKLHFFY